MNTTMLTILKQIIAQYGEAVLEDSTRFKNLLADLAAKEPRPQRLVLVMCVQKGYHRELQKTPEDQRGFCKKRLADKLHRQEGLDLTLCGDTLDVLAAALPAPVQPVPEGLVCEIGIAGYTGEALSLVIPDRIQDLPVTSIGDYAFSHCSGLTSISLPDSVESIGDYAFAGCDGLRSISLPDSLISIGEWAFWGCKELRNISFPDSVESIGDYAFYKCEELRSINLPASLTSIGDWAFCECKGLTGINLPASLISIGDGAFYECKGLTGISLPASLTSIGKSAFSFCEGLTSINLPASLTSIGDYAFALCHGLTSISLPDSLISIGDEAFAGCEGLTAITVTGENTKYASSNGVLFDKNMRTLIVYPGGKGGSYTVPSSVASIRYNAFWRCHRLTAIIVADGNTRYASSNGVLFDKNMRTLIVYPSGKGGSYTVPASVASIRDEAFYWCHRLTSISLPDSLTFIRDKAFAECEGLTAVSLSRKTAVGKNAFPSGVQINYR